MLGRVGCFEKLRRGDRTSRRQTPDVAGWILQDDRGCGFWRTPVPVRARKLPHLSGAGLTPEVDARTCQRCARGDIAGGNEESPSQDRLGLSGGRRKRRRLWATCSRCFWRPRKLQRSSRFDQRGIRPQDPVPKPISPTNRPPWAEEPLGSASPGRS